MQIHAPLTQEYTHTQLPNDNAGHAYIYVSIHAFILPNYDMHV